MGVDFTKALCLTRRIIGKRVIKLWRALRSKRVMGLEAERPVHMMELVVRSFITPHDYPSRSLPIFFRKNQLGQKLTIVEPPKSVGTSDLASFT